MCETRHGVFEYVTHVIRKNTIVIMEKDDKIKTFIYVGENRMKVSIVFTISQYI